MVMFVHIADERDAASIRRNGLVLPKLRLAVRETDIIKFGVFALPVVSNFIASHQWVRELKRRGHRTAVGVYFRISDEEPVWAGRYNQPKARITAAQAAARLRQHESLGFEVVIPRSIRAAELSSIRAIPQAIGWRYSPEAKGKPPFCGCSYCQRGNIKSRRLRAEYESA